MIFRSPIIAVLPLLVITLVSQVATGLISDVNKMLNLNTDSSISTIPVPPEYSIGRLTCRYWQPAWRCDGWLAGCP